MAEITHFGRLKKELERLRAIEDRANAVFGLIDPRTVNEYGRGQYAAACAILAVDGPPEPPPEHSPSCPAYWDMDFTTPGVCRCGAVPAPKEETPQ